MPLTPDQMRAEQEARLRFLSQRGAGIPGVVPPPAPPAPPAPPPPPAGIHDAPRWTPPAAGPGLNPASPPLPPGWQGQVDWLKDKLGFMVPEPPAKPQPPSAPPNPLDAIYLARGDQRNGSPFADFQSPLENYELEQLFSPNANDPQYAGQTARDIAGNSIGVDFVQPHKEGSGYGLGSVRFDEAREDPEHYEQVANRMLRRQRAEAYRSPQQLAEQKARREQSAHDKQLLDLRRRTELATAQHGAATAVTGAGNPQRAMDMKHSMDAFGEFPGIPKEVQERLSSMVTEVPRGSQENATQYLARLALAADSGFGGIPQSRETFAEQYRRAQATGNTAAAEKAQRLMDNPQNVEAMDGLDTLGHLIWNWTDLFRGKRERYSPFASHIVRGEDGEWNAVSIDDMLENMGITKKRDPKTYELMRKMMLQGLERGF